MNEAIHFLEAINAGEPNADLIYADWLEEQGRPEADEIRDPAPVVLPIWFGSICLSKSGISHCSKAKSHVWTKCWSESRTNSNFVPLFWSESVALEGRRSSCSLSKNGLKSRQQSYSRYRRIRG